MITQLSQLVVTEGPYETCAVHAPYLHHRHFPESAVRGETTLDAARNLYHRFQRELDSVAEDQHRERLINALDDLRAFLADLESADLAAEIR